MEPPAMNRKAIAQAITQREEALADVRALLIEKLRVRREPDEIDPDTPLFGSGLALDSIDAVDLVILLKSELGVEIPDDEYGRANLRTVQTLVDLVLQARDGTP
jgi:acyl carrier protein